MKHENLSDIVKYFKIKAIIILYNPDSKNIAHACSLDTQLSLLKHEIKSLGTCPN